MIPALLQHLTPWIILQLAMMKQVQLGNLPCAQLQMLMRMLKRTKKAIHNKV